MGIRIEIDKIASEHPTDDAYALAAALVKRMKRDDFIPLLAEEIAHAQRGVVRSAEQAAFRAVYTAKAKQPLAPPADLDAFKSLFDKSFKLGDGNDADWLGATEEQHLQRIAMLEKLRSGLDRTIERHREAVRLIRQHGVACLGDIPDAAIVAA